MHEAVVTVLSVRKDGTAFKADPGKGEIWFSLPDSLKGKVEWKKRYHIRWTENKGERGTFNNIKLLMPESEGSQQAVQAAEAKPNGAPASNGSGPEKGMIIKESVALLYAGCPPNKIVEFFKVAEEIYQHIKAPKVEDTYVKETYFTNDLDDTFDR